MFTLASKTVITTLKAFTAQTAYAAEKLIYFKKDSLWEIFQKAQD